MNNQKLKEYRLTRSIHTLSVKSEGTVIDIYESVAYCIEPVSRTENGIVRITSKLNRNKLYGDVFNYR